MASKRYYIGVDIGTTSTKAVLYDETMNVIEMNYKGYPLYSPSSSIAEQDPDEIFHAVLTTIKEVMKEIDPSKVEFVSFSSAMHSLIAIDHKGKPLTRCITWADTRAAKWAEKIKNEQNGLNIYRRTGTPIHPMAPLAKICWLRNDHPEIFNKTEKFIGIKEYVFYKLFGEYIVDYSIASATGMFNLKDLKWDKGALEVAGIGEEKLPKPVSTTFTIKGIYQSYAEVLGLPADTPFVIGASDGVLSNLGVNAIDPGVVAITIGTSGAIRAVTNKPVTDPKGRVFCYALTEDYWVIGGPVNNGGGTFRWIRDELATDEVETAKRLGKDPYEILTELASKVTPGSDGLLFLPYLTGERAPLWNADAKGVFFGLALHHKKEHLIRSVMEGVILNLYTVMLALQEIIGIPKKIQATGGFARSDLWKQMLADIFNQEVNIPESFESSCLGAVILGMKLLVKLMISLLFLNGLVPQTFIFQSLKMFEIYEKLVPIFIRVTRNLQDEFGEITKFQQKWTK